MKINIEIKDNKLIHFYKIGSSEQGGTREVCPEDLIMFSNILTHLWRSVERKFKLNKEKEEE